ncbi:hypothetical protein ABPG75_004749 [Micractinium tetrahymenae]
MTQAALLPGLAGSSRTPSGGACRAVPRLSPVRASAGGSGGERSPQRPARPHLHHAPPSAGAQPEHRPAAGRLANSAVPLPHSSPALRSLATSSASLAQLRERYAHALPEATTATAVAVEQPAQVPALQRWRSGELPGGLPRLPALPRSLSRQLALARRHLEQQQQQQGEGAEEALLSRDALTLVLLATAVSFICSIDRAAMSVAILPMSEQFQWDDSIKGAVSSAFFAGYMVTNLCGGFLATRYSAKGVLALGVVLWSVFTIATPAAAGGNLNQLMLARAMMGVGEGVTYPSIQNLARKWVPETKRSRALAFIYSGHQLGTIGSYLLCPLLISQLGWESIFLGFGSLGFFWLLFWQPMVKDEAETAPAQQAGQAGQPATAGPAAVGAAASSKDARQLRLQDVPWAAFARSRAFWAIVAAQSTVSVGNVLAFSWLPTFYNQVYGVDVASSSFLSVLPFVATVLATNAAGWIADGLINNKVMDKTSTRKLMQAIASLGPAACLAKLALDQGQGSTASMADAVALVTAWVSLCGFSAAGYGSNHQDISKEYSGIIYGLCNGIGSICASASIYATGQVLHTTHDWALVFEVAAGLYALGALAYLQFASCEEQFAPTGKQELAAAAAAGSGAAPGGGAATPQR